MRPLEIAMAPSLIPANGCLSRSLNIPSSAPLERVQVADSAELHWYGEIATGLDRLRQRLGPDAEVVDTRAKLVERAP